MIIVLPIKYQMPSNISKLSAWSSGMIPRSGRGGLGFDSPSGPFSLSMLWVHSFLLRKLHFVVEDFR